MKNTIKDFVNSKKIGLVGISSDNKKYGNALFREISAKGYDVYPVSRNSDVIEGRKCHKTISELYGVVDSVIIATNKKDTLELVRKIEPGKIKNIWFCKGTNTPESIEEAKAKNMNIVSGYCPLMFMDPKSIHKVHEFFSRLFRLYPRDNN